MPTARPRLAALLFGLALGALSSCAPAQRPPAAEAARPAGPSVPARLDDSTFWRLVSETSEPDGFFRSDNLVSNEVTFQHVIPALLEEVGTGGVYLGVGPDQNFTYIAALRPRIAFIVDVRRGNLLQHLLYKALLEASATRAEFLERLLGRARPAGLAADAPVDSLIAAFERAAPDSALRRRAFDEAVHRLREGHGFPLTDDEVRGMEYVHVAFHAAGPDLTYAFPNGRASFGPRRMPTYGELAAQTDAEGVARGYLASEATFRALRDMQRANLVVPVVGDFSGDRALRGVGAWLRAHGATVSVFYLSNVEQYLFRQGDDWRRFLDNVATLPLDSTSTFLRSVFNDLGYRAPLPAPSTRAPTVRSVTLRASIPGTLHAYAEGRVRSYFDVVELSR